MRMPLISRHGFFASICIPTAGKLIDVMGPTDATIIGRVTGISMDIVEAEENEARA